MVLTEQSWRVTEFALPKIGTQVRKLVDESLAQTEQAIGEALDHTTLADSGSKRPLHLT